jgi:Carboxypeptidase regulatory-like domain
MRIVAFTVLSLITGVGALWAQTGATSLRGTIIDRGGAVIAPAKVTLTDRAKSLGRQITTNNCGVYEFPALPPGTYRLTVEMGGFRTCRPVVNRDTDTRSGPINGAHDSFEGVWDDKQTF